MDGVFWVRKNFTEKNTKNLNDMIQTNWGTKK